MKRKELVLLLIFLVFGLLAIVLTKNIRQNTSQVSKKVDTTAVHYKINGR